MNLRYTFSVVIAFLFSLLLNGQANNLEQKALEYYQSKLAKELKVDRDYFKLYPGSSTIGNTSMWMWNIFDAMSNSEGIFYNPAQANNFSQEYGKLLYSIKVQEGEDSCNLQDAIITYSEAGVKVWDVTIDSLINGLSKSDELTFDTDTVLYYYQQGHSEKTEATISISVSFTKSLVLYSFPYSVKDTLDHIMKSYEPWFTPCILREAYLNEDHHYLSQEKWNKLFSANGTMQNICVALVVARGGFFEINAIDNNFSFNTTTTLGASMLIGVIIYPIEKFSKVANGNQSK